MPNFVLASGRFSRRRLDDAVFGTGAQSGSRWTWGASLVFGNRAGRPAAPGLTQCRLLVLPAAEAQD